MCIHYLYTHIRLHFNIIIGAFIHSKQGKSSWIIRGPFFFSENAWAVPGSEEAELERLKVQEEQTKQKSKTKELELDKVWKCLGIGLDGFLQAWLKNKNCLRKTIC